MRPESLFAAFVVAASVFNVAETSAGLGPQFNDIDRATIAGNRLLANLVDDDPWLVRSLLDHLQTPLPSMRRRQPTSESAGLMNGRAADNPDLMRGGSGNQNALEWIALLRRAKARKDRLDTSPNRTAEGSLELIEMMKRAKAKKQDSTVK